MSDTIRAMMTISDLSSPSTVNDLCDALAAEWPVYDFEILDHRVYCMLVVDVDDGVEPGSLRDCSNMRHFADGWQKREQTETS